MKKEISFRSSPPLAVTRSKVKWSAVKWLAVARCAAGLLTDCANDGTPPPSRNSDRLDRGLHDAAESLEKLRGYNAAVGLSRSLRHLQQVREARAIMLRALKKAPKNLALKAEPGKVQRTKGEPLKAMDTRSRVDAKLETKRREVIVALAISHDRVGMYKQAERRYLQALEVSPENAVILNGSICELYA